MFSYLTPSAYRSDFSRSQLALSCDLERPLRFEGRLRQQHVLVRTALRSLGELIWYQPRQGWNLDPVISLYPDALIWEGFSSDMSCYGRLSLDTQLFDIFGPVSYGTTNVHFTSWLWAALGELRSSRETIFRLDSQGFEVDSGSGRFQPQVELPPHWPAAFSEVQQALIRPQLRLEVEPAELLAPIRFLRYHKNRLSPQALRYQCDRDGWKIVLEPWEETFALDSLPPPASDQPPRRVRTWGRRRLHLIEPLLPWAEGLTIRLCGRALPHFYHLSLPGMSFLLGLTGWSEQTFQHSLLTYGCGGVLGSPLDHQGGAPEASALEERRRQLEQALTLPQHPLDRHLVAQGLALSQPEGNLTRYRPLSSQLRPSCEADPRIQEASQLTVEGVQCQAVESLKYRKLPGQEEPIPLVRRDWQCSGTCQGHSLQLTVSEREHILFGRCGCDFFEQNLLNRGPCAHLLALFLASRSRRSRPEALPGEEATRVE